MEEISAKSQMAKIRNFERGFVATHLINIGAKLDLFETLNRAKEGLTAQDLASKLGLHETYVKTWCQTAYHYELLDAEEDGRFKLQPHLDEILGDRSHFKNYLANIALAVDHMGKYFGDFPDYYRTGASLPSLYEADLSAAVSETTKNMHLVFSFMILPKNEDLRDKLSQGVRVLEIGCGHGNLIVQLAQAFPNSTFLGVDPDEHATRSAKEKIAQAGLQDRVSVECSGGEELTFENEFDLVCSVVSVHEFLPSARKQVLAKAHQALKRDGQLLIIDFPYPAKLEDFRNPMYDMAILEQFVEICCGYVHLNTNERNDMLEQVGFKDVQQKGVGKGMFELVMATK